MENAIQNFYEINMEYPKQIFVYRDGVSNSELESVVKKELEAIRLAARNVAIHEPNPAIQFMVVQKRTNVRFFEPDRLVHPNKLKSKDDIILLQQMILQWSN